MKYGLPKTTIEHIRGVFARFPEIEKAILYGSRAKGTYHVGSDIDLTLYGDALTSDLRDKIVDALDDLLLPYTIDLSLFDELDHAKLREHIERVGVVFYERAKPVAGVRGGWETKNIGQVCEIVNGGTPKTSVKKFWDGDHQWITPAEMGNRSTPYVSKTERKITDEGLSNSSAKLIPPKSVILSSRAPIGHLVINTEFMATNQGCKGLVPSEELHYKYLYYYLLNNVDLLNSLGTGATFKELSGGKLKEVPIPLPPLPEQKRIVSILDEAFAGIATAIANAKKNLVNANELFHSHLQSLFAIKGEGWVDTTVGDQVALQRGFDITKSQQRDGEVPVVSSGGIKSFHDTPMVNAPGVVIGRKGTLGKCFFIDRDYWPHDTTLWVKDFRGNEPRFVYYLLLGLNVKHLDSGAANPALNRNQVHQIKISWPQVSKQKELIQRFDMLSDETQRLESIYQQKLTALDDLKKSILNQAFSGQLH